MGECRGETRKFRQAIEVLLVSRYVDKSRDECCKIWERQHKVTYEYPGFENCNTGLRIL